MDKPIIKRGRFELGSDPEFRVYNTLAKKYIVVTPYTNSCGTDHSGRCAELRPSHGGNPSSLRTMLRDIMCHEANVSLLRPIYEWHVGAFIGELPLGAHLHVSAKNTDTTGVNTTRSALFLHLMDLCWGVPSRLLDPLEETMSRMRASYGHLATTSGSMVRIRDYHSTPINRRGLEYRTASSKIMQFPKQLVICYYLTLLIINYSTKLQRYKLLKKFGEEIKVLRNIEAQILMGGQREISLGSSCYCPDYCYQNRYMKENWTTNTIAKNTIDTWREITHRSYPIILEEITHNLPISRIRALENFYSFLLGAPNPQPIQCLKQVYNIGSKYKNLHPSAIDKVESLLGYLDEEMND